MITKSDIVKFAKDLDTEYEKEIKPMLIDAHKDLRKVFNIVLNNEVDEICHKCSKSVFNFKYVNYNTWGIITNLLYTVQNKRPQELPIPSCGGHYSGYSSNFTITELVKYIKSYSESINVIKQTKERFNGIRNAYNSLFVNDDGKNFKQLVSDVMEWKETLFALNKKDDDEIYALFGQDNPRKKIRVTIKIEEV